ncbi:WS/DGAT/MGAT family O-acyltransferase [Phreatobacter aquaticus]|nr:wax ester/triacylglycerol synthase family O-acyltransferase [Phreatobacter aquaticus]
MKQLSGIDATFLYMETPETPMHVAGLTLYDRPKGMTGSFHDHFTAFLKTRIHLIPIFSKKLARTLLDLDHPGWVDTADVDFAYHVRQVVLDGPGSFDQLEAKVGELHSVLLDRSKPLWQFTVIEGLADGRLALYSKVHHAAVDGGAGMVITKALYDVTEVPRVVEPPEPRALPPKPSQAERALTGLNDLVGNLMRQHLNMLAAGAELITSVAGALSPAGSGKAPAADEPKTTSGGAQLPSFVPPKTPFNVTITGQRAYAARSLPLADAKLIAKATGAKINDVVMGICSGALRRYLLARKKLPKTPLIAFVPISLREAGNTEINNQVFGMNCPLATDIADPLERLASIRRTSNTSKSIAGTAKSAAPKDFTMIGAPLLLPGLMKLFGKSGLADLVPMGVNVVISNTAGPNFPLYCAGAKISALYPVSIPTHGVGLNFTVQSYLDHLDFGLTGCAKAVPDMGRLADHLAEALAELKTAVVAKMAAAAPHKNVEASPAPSQEPAKDRAATAADGKAAQKPVAAKAAKPSAKPKAGAAKARVATAPAAKPASAKAASAKAASVKTRAPKAAAR